MIKWDETEFVECLEVVPEVEEDGVYYAFTVVDNGVTLNLTLYPDDGDVYITLSRTENGKREELIDIKITDCQMAAVKSRKDDQFIEFAPGRVFGGRYDENFVIPYGVRVHRKPNIKVSMFSKNV